MTLTEHKIWHLPLLLLLALWLGGCSMHEDIEPDPIQKFTIRIHLNTNSAFTRASDDVWGGEYDGIEGSSFENRISKVDVFLLDATGMSSSRLVASRDTTYNKDNVYVFHLYGNTPGVSYDAEQNKLTFNGRIMAIANANSDDSWQDSKIPYEMKYGEDGWLIPMWGIEDYENITLDANKITDLNEDGQEIYMLRAVSKIVVKLDTETTIRQDYILESIEMVDDSPRLFGEGFTLPKDAQTTLSTRSLNLEDCFFPNSSDDVMRINTPNFVKVNDFEKYTYVSESETEENKPFAFEVTLKSLRVDRPDIKGILYFSNYKNYAQDTTITNVVRNHIYEFTIRLAELQLHPSVKKWTFGGKVHIDL